MVHLSCSDFLPSFLLLRLTLLILLVSSKTKGLVKLPADVSVPAVFVFGDSVVDTGNNNNRTTSFARSNFPPYGRDFQGGIPTGRFSNGKVPSDLIVEELGIKELLPAYLKPNLQSSDLITGVCFASGGSGYDPLTSILESSMPLTGQVDLLKEYIGKLKELVGENRAKFILANSLFVVVAGSSDISNTYRTRSLLYDLPAYTDLLVNSASNFLTEINELGARRIAVFSAPPIGCLPFQRTVGGGIERRCAERPNNLAQLFNTKLSKEVDSLNRNFPNSRNVFINVYDPLLDIITNYQKYGYRVGDTGCCGTGRIEVAILCNSFDSSCPNVQDYVFWDSFHPTESVYKRLINPILQKYLYQFKAVVKLPPNVSVPAVLVFGDSIVDTGNNNNNLGTTARCNYPPYGKDFEGGKPTGRFSNGKVPSDFIAEELGIKEYVPAYLDPHLQPGELATGVCFASGGAGYDPLTSQSATAIPLSGQLDMFKEYIVKLKGHVGEDRTNFILANGLFFVVLGSNDISNTYFLTHLRELQYDVPTYSDFMLNSASNFFEEIYQLGARRIAVVSAPPVGCVPFHRTLSGGIARKCVQKYNDAVLLFNDKLSKKINSLNQKLPNSRIVYFDVYNPLLDVTVNHQKYGYKVGDRGCCGTGNLEVALTCNHLDATCSNVLDYVFWDGFHPSESVYKQLVPPLLQKYIHRTMALAKLPPNASSVPAVLAFGDSIVDPGNNNNIKTLIKCNFPPYGKDFQGGNPTGRFCNGKIPSDLIAEQLGIKEYLPAYLDPNLKSSDLVTGVCFASGASGYDPLTPKITSVLSLSTQLDMFREYIGKLKGIVGESRTNYILSNSLYLVVAGSDDIANTYFVAHARILQYDIPSYTDLMVNSASNFVKELYNLGARRVAVLGAPPIGCVPSQRTLAGGLTRKCSEKYNYAARLFNSKLSKELDSLGHNLSDTRIVYIDVYTPLLDIIENYQKYGYKVMDRGCCGTGKLEVAVLCNPLDATCSNASEYVFWDSYHPTEGVYRKLVNYVLEKYIDRLF
ncbi:GDSL esterase/lipase EXL3 [Glycine max]|nr:GDSL esterase/lipase EXL3 [Glycine max]